MSHRITSKITKTLLADSLKTLMKTKSLHKITIQEIVDSCSVNRRTFYRHFQDIYDLIHWIYKQEILDEIKKSTGYENWQEGLLHLFYYIQQNREISLCSFHSLDRAHLEQFLYTSISQLINPVIKQRGQEMNAKDKNIKWLSNFYALVFSALVIQWMQEDMKENPEEIINKLSIIMTGSISSILCEKN